MQLGHEVVGFSMTERYATWSPDYLEKSTAAIDKLLRASIPSDAPANQSRTVALQLRA
ncbi:hypothetical protein [Rhizobium leguminosarum]